MRTVFLTIILLTVAHTSWAQLPPACAGGSPATTCANACINCDFNGYNGTTAGFPSDVVPNFCGTVENAQWLGFIAGAVHATFSVTPSNCSDGNGVQIALYEDCMGQPLACEKGEMDGGNITVSIDVQITPGRNYFLLIDGYAGDQCDFSVSVSPGDAVYEPPLGTVGSITGPDKVCPGATMTYQVTPVSGAGAYIWSGPPGAMIDTVPLPATLVGPGANQAQITFGATGGDICVQAANSCQQTAPCSIPFNVQMLDDSYRPVLRADSSAHLTCSGQPLALEVDVQSSTGFSFQWTADSTGHIISGQQFKKATVDKTGTYTLLVINGQNGCSNKVDIHVGEPDTPRTADLRLQQVSCYKADDGLLKIAGVEGGLSPYTYALDGQNFQLSPEFRYLKPGYYPLTIETADECRWDTLIQVTEPADFTINLGYDTLIHLGDPIQMWQGIWVSDPQRIQTLSIQPPDLSSMFCENCDYLPLHSFKYRITAIDSNGCRAIDERIVSVDKQRWVYVPNVFAPDGGTDGNDRFTVYGGDDVERVEFLRVFDRWGQLIFEQNSAFQANDSEAGWNGSIRGEKALPAVYVWKAAVLFKDGETEERSGSVTVVR